jgi:hypothetical protein
MITECTKSAVQSCYKRNTYAIVYSLKTCIESAQLRTKNVNRIFKIIKNNNIMHKNFSIIVSINIKVWTFRAIPFLCNIGWSFQRNFGRPMDLVFLGTHGTRFTF